MISVFDMSSGELLQQKSCPERRVCRCQDREAEARAYRDERDPPLSLELALLPVEASERR